MATTEKTNDKKVIKAIDKIKKIINKANLNIPELIVLYGNLGYHIGASMGGYSSPGPDLKTLDDSYRTNPTIDVALMLQGLTVTNWEQMFLENPKLSNLASLKKEEK